MDPRTTHRIKIWGAYRGIGVNHEITQSSYESITRVFYARVFLSSLLFYSYRLSHMLLLLLLLLLHQTEFDIGICVLHLGQKKQPILKNNTVKCKCRFSALSEIRSPVQRVKARTCPPSLQVGELFDSAPGNTYFRPNFCVHTECDSSGLNIRKSGGLIKSLIPVSTTPLFYQVIRVSTPIVHLEAMLLCHPSKAR
jgi:hypothetical protein